MCVFHHEISPVAEPKKFWHRLKHTLLSPCHARDIHEKFINPQWPRNETCLMFSGSETSSTILMDTHWTVVCGHSDLHFVGMMCFHHQNMNPAIGHVEARRLCGSKYTLLEKSVRRLLVIVLLTVLIPVVACGGSRSATPQGNSLSGNWQITLSAGSSSALAFTGFLIQSGNSLNGSLIIPSASVLTCPGVSPATGTFDGQNVSLNIDQDQLGDTISLSGTTVNVGAPISGNFTSQSGTCKFPSSGTWAAVPIAPIGKDTFGSFHGTFNSTAGNGSVTVKGTLNQGPNTGSSTATLSGTFATTSGAAFCSYVLPGTITGLISGTSVQLNLIGENGLQYAQLGRLGHNDVTVTPDGTSLTGAYLLSATSNSCPSPDTGTFTLSFP
jgi:hypothetical protein